MQRLSIEFRNASKLQILLVTNRQHQRSHRLDGTPGASAARGVATARQLERQQHPRNRMTSSGAPPRAGARPAIAPPWHEHLHQQERAHDECQLVGGRGRQVLVQLELLAREPRRDRHSVAIAEERDAYELLRAQECPASRTPRPAYWASPRQAHCPMSTSRSAPPRTS